jgi:hypothetical protein
MLTQVGWMTRYALTLATCTIMWCTAVAHQLWFNQCAQPLPIWACLHRTSTRMFLRQARLVTTRSSYPCDINTADLRQ